MLTKERLLLLAVLAVLLASVFFSNYWHAFAYKRGSISLALYSFQKAASEKECFELLIIPENLEQAEQELRIYLDSKEVLRKNILISEKQKEKFCFDLSDVNYGKHFAEVFLGNRKLFYGFEKVKHAETSTPEIEIIGAQNNVLHFRVKNFPQSVYVPIEIWVNDKLDHAVYANAKEQEFREKLTLEKCINKVTIKALGSESTVEVPGEAHKSNWVLGILVLLLGVVVFVFFVFPREELFARFALSIASTLALFVFIGLILGFLKRFALFELLVCYGSALILIAFFFRKRFALAEQKLSFNTLQKELSIEAILVAVFFIYLAIFYGMFIPSHKTYFNIFYERGTAQLLENAGLPAIDELSYLGRSFTFIPGYFYIEGSFGLLTGLERLQLFALTLCFASIFFLFATIALAKGLKLKNSAMLFPVFLAMSTFIFSTLTLTPRHCIALSFLMVALLLLLKKRFALALITLFAALLVQIPNAVFFLAIAPFTLMVAKQGISIRKAIIGTAKPLAIACLLFSITYIALFWHAGLPYQIVPHRWGYLISLGPLFVLADPGILFFLFGFFVALEIFFIFKGYARLTKEKKLLFIASMLALSIEAFVSTRFVLVSAFFIALFICYFIESYPKKFSELFTMMLAFTLLLGIYIAIILSQSFTVGPEVDAATRFLKQYSSSNENVLADPYFAHLIAYDSGRRTLADLMVEYADEAKFSDAYRFLKEKDYNILEKYNIALVFSEKFLINEDVVENKPLAKELEFEKLAKIFTNERISIHRKID
ncbi:MAG: hypothetical protein J7L44_01695 [Candidatus Diapherotrites archaeon]|nr:hypothetical protein [Candidatus Diapherotrites archaeon]